MIVKWIHIVKHHWIWRLRMAYKRVVLGYDDSAYYDLNAYIAEIAAPVLRRMQRQGCYVSGMTYKQWNKKLGKMALAFELIIEDNWWKIDNKKKAKQDQQIEEGLELFRKYYRDLWT